MSQTYYTEQGQAVRLGQELGRGGEGSVCAIDGHAADCAKIYSKKLSADHERKLVVMVENPPTDPTWKSAQHRSIAWPSAVLYGDKNKSAFAGFVMPRLDPQQFKTLFKYLSPDDRQKNFGGAFTWKYLFTTARNLASAVAAIHERGYCVGDLNESNILLAPTALVTLIDCDSFQVPDQAQGKTYRCPVGKPEYTAPELQGKSFRDFDRTQATDAFALAVLLFQLLMEGVHPYSARGPLVENAASTQAKLVLGHFPYLKRKGVEPPDYAPAFDLLSLELQKLFLRSFVEGHQSPAKRPSAREWLVVLSALEKKFATCGQNKFHHYLSHLKKCPWCERAAKTGTDPYSSGVGTQVALPRPAAPSGSRTSPAPSPPRGRPARVRPPSSSSPRTPTGKHADLAKRRLIAGAVAGTAAVFLLGGIGAFLAFGGKAPTSTTEAAKGGGAQPSSPFGSGLLDPLDPKRDVSFEVVRTKPEKPVEDSPFEVELRAKEGGTPYGWEFRAMLGEKTQVEVPPPDLFSNPIRVRLAVPKGAGESLSLQIAQVGGSKQVQVGKWKVEPNPWLSLTERQPFQVKPNPVQAFSFSPSRALLAAVSQGHAVELWRVSDGKLLRTLAPAEAESQPVGRPPLPGTPAGPGGRPIPPAPQPGTVPPILPRGGSGFPGEGSACVAFSPKGGLIATAGPGNAATLWRLTNGDRSLTEADAKADPYASLIDALAFSPDGTLLAAGCRDRTVRLWKIEAGRAVFFDRLVGLPGSVQSVAFSPDGKTLAIGSHEGTIKLWEHASKTVRELKVDDRDRDVIVSALAFSETGELLAGGCHHGTIQVWSVSGWKPLTTMKAGPDRSYYGQVLSLAFDQDAKTLAAATSNEVQLWRVADGHLLRKLSEERSLVLNLSFVAGGPGLISCSADGMVRFWASPKTENRLPVAELVASTPAKPFVGGRFSLTLAALDPDGDPVKYEYRMGSDSKWKEAANGLVSEELREEQFKGGDLQLAVSYRATDGQGSDPAGQSLGPIAVEKNPWSNWNELDKLDSKAGAVTSLAFNQDGSILASGHMKGAIAAWKKEKNKFPPSPFKIPKPASDAVTLLGFFSDGRFSYLASGTSGDVPLEFWQVPGYGRITPQPPAGPAAFLIQIDPVYSMVAGKTGLVFAAGEDPSRIFFWTWERAGQNARLVPLGSLLIQAAWEHSSERGRYRVPSDKATLVLSLDGSRIAVNLGAGRVPIYDTKKLAQEQPLSILGDPSAQVAAMAFSKNGSLLAILSQENDPEGKKPPDKKLQLWRVADGQLLGTCRGDAGLIQSMTFDPDEKVLAGGGKDGKTYLWRVADGELWRAFDGTAPVLSLAFNADGNLLAVGTTDGSVRLWGPPPDKPTNSE